MRTRLVFCGDCGWTYMAGPFKVYCSGEKMKQKHLDTEMQLVNPDRPAQQPPTRKALAMWTTSSGNATPIAEMSNQHIENTIAMLRRMTLADSQVYRNLCEERNRRDQYEIFY